MLESTIKLNFKDKLIPVVIQDYKTNEVLMLAYMNEKAFIKTIRTGYTHFWSRSRKKIWFKGETSSNFQRVKEMYVDCDGDAILIKVEQFGNACHLGKRSCFHKRISMENFLKDCDED